MTPSIVLIFGAGSNVGSSVAKAFLAKGHKVALASRSQNPETSTETELHIPTDCSDTDSVLNAFAKTKSEFGFPNVVIYNSQSSFQCQIPPSLTRNSLFRSIQQRG
jgi:NAD(P)-dependent dehydrogenase (short-subunit alcohol dehydrogenase family)